MADEAYFEDAADTAPETAPEESNTSETQTALLPKDFFGSKPLEVGTECKVRIEKIMDDEVQVAYVPHGTKEESDDGMPADLMEDMG